MLKYHVAVCDDEKSDLDGIVQSVQQYDVQGCFDIETYMDGNELLSELQMQKKSFDLLLLDIEMPSNGFQLAQSLIQMEKHPLVVFVTKRHEYAVQGYGIAFRYLVKPLDQTLFAAAMDAVLQELNSKHFTIECRRLQNTVIPKNFTRSHRPPRMFSSVLQIFLRSEILLLMLF